MDGYRYRAGEREHPEWISFEDEYRTSIRRREAVLDTFKRKRRKGSVENAIRSAVARWTDRLSLEERHIYARPPPAIEHWENCIADRLITVLEEKLGRPLRFSWNALTQKVFGRDLQLLAALFQVGTNTESSPDGV